MGIAVDWHSVGCEHSEFSPAFDAKRVLFRNKAESLESDRVDRQRKGVEEGEELGSWIETVRLILFELRVGEPLSVNSVIGSEIMDVKGESDDNRSESTFGMMRVSGLISKIGDDMENIGRSVFGEISAGSAGNMGSRPNVGDCRSQVKE